MINEGKDEDVEDGEDEVEDKKGNVMRGNVGNTGFFLSGWLDRR